jgi:hypothetical protein
MESTPEIVFEDKKSFPDDQEGISLSPDLSITKTELFNVDMAYYLKGQPIGAPAKKVITAMSKGKSKGNQWDVNYVLGRKIKNEFTGRMIAKRSIGLQGLEHDIRGALARDYYWDLDIANCQVELLRQMAVKHGWVSTEITSYCNNREEKLQQLCLETKEERWEMKVRFIRLLFGGNRRVDDPKWLFDRFYPEVNKLMKNIAGVYPDIYKSCLKTKKDNPYGACCAHVLQTEERGCLLSFDQYLTKMGRSMDVLIHDGGYVRKVGDEKKFPEDLLRGGEEYIKKLTGYQVKLVQKAIETTFTLPNAVEV